MSFSGSLAGGRSNFSGGGRQIEKSFFISVENVQYNRDVAISYGRLGQPTDKKSPSHVLTVNGNFFCANLCRSSTSKRVSKHPSYCRIPAFSGAKGAWTESNRDMAFALYDSWRRAHILRNQVIHLFDCCVLNVQEVVLICTSFYHPLSTLNTPP